MAERAGEDRRVALVTGASRGIGRGIALALAEEGLDVAVNYRSNRALAEEVVAQIEGLGRKSLALGADVSQPGQVEMMLAAVAQEFGRLDVLVNSAGVGKARTLETLTLEEWEQTLRVDLTGVFLLCRAALPLLRRSSSGRIINIASLSGVNGGTMGPHYAAAKAGVIGLTKSLARELAPLGITVNAIAPGPIATDMAREHPPELLANMVRETPLGRLGRVEEVAALAAFLATDAAGFISGETVIIDGARLRH